MEGTFGWWGFWPLSGSKQWIGGELGVREQSQAWRSGDGVVIAVDRSQRWAMLGDHGVTHGRDVWCYEMEFASSRSTFIALSTAAVAMRSRALTSDHGSVLRG